MPSESIIPYRLLGDHPAASGRHFFLPFSGDSVLVSHILSNVVKEHHVNESLYKFEVRLISRASNSTTAAPTFRIVNPHESLSNYDPIDIHVLKKGFTDLVGHSSPGIHATFNVSPADSDEDTPASSQPPSSSKNKDLLLYRRSAAVAQKSFPLRKGCRTQDPSMQGCDQCLLCELEPYAPVKLPCCGFVVCTFCKQTGERLTNSSSCVVCGHTSNQQTTRRGVKSQETSFSLLTGGATPHDSHMLGQGLSPDEVERHASIIHSNLDKSLALLDRSPQNQCRIMKRRRSVAMDGLDDRKHHSWS